jgi:hypothetical protein
MVTDNASDGNRKVSRPPGRESRELPCEISDPASRFESQIPNHK